MILIDELAPMSLEHHPFEFVDSDNAEFIDVVILDLHGFRFMV
jgi:hypothetical protein